MVLLELAKGLLLARDLGGKGVLKSGDGTDGSSSPLGGEEGLSNEKVQRRRNMRGTSRKLAHDELETGPAS